MDKLQKRIDEGRCLICKEIIDGPNEDNRALEYKGHEILICRRHTRLKIENLSGIV